MKDNHSKEQFRKSPYIKRFQIISLAVPFLIVAISIVLSIHQSNWEYFSRGGSLIVVVGIYIAYMDLSGAIYEHAQSDYFTMSEFLEFGNIGELEKEDLNELVEKAKEVEKTKSNNKKFANYASRKFRKMEAVLLIGGTIVWGYGDLILRDLSITPH